MAAVARCEVVLVHGLWMRPWVMAGLAHGLRRRGYRCHLFGYRSVGAPLALARRRLRAYLEALPAPRVVLVGHSLGGRLAASVAHPKVVSALLLGTPLAPARAACVLARHRLARRLGGFGLHALTRPLSVPPPHPVSALAGTGGQGMGRWLGGLPRPHDGTVAVAETRAPWLREHGCLPVSHSSFLVRPLVVAVLARYLETGRLPRPPVVDCPP